MLLWVYPARNMSLYCSFHNFIDFLFPLFFFFSFVQLKMKIILNNILLILLKSDLIITLFHISFFFLIFMHFSPSISTIFRMPCLNSHSQKNVSAALGIQLRRKKKNCFSFFYLHVNTHTTLWQQMLGTS